MSELVGAFPLSLPQQDIYFDQLHFGQSPLYNVGGYIRMGRCDVDRLSAAHARLVSGNDVFGIRIRSTDRGVRQEISSQRTTELTLVDLSQEVDPVAVAKSKLEALFQEPFELEGSELYKAFVIKLTDAQYWYVCLAHHLIMDGWGFANLARVLGEHYHDQTPAPPPPWQDIASSDEAYLASRKYGKDREHWLAHLGAAPEKLLTPFYEERFKGSVCIPSGRESVRIEPSEFEEVRAVADRLGVGVPQVLLAALVTYVSQAYGRERLIVGVPAHNRRGHREKQMLGAFTGVSPLSVDTGEDLTFAELAQSLREDQRKNFRHQRYPIGHLVRDLGLTGRNDSLYDLGFNYLKLNSFLNVGGEQAELVYLTHFHETTPLMLTVWEYGEELPIELQFDYNHAYFEPAEAALLAQRFLHLLRAEVDAGGSVPLSDLPLLSQGEHEQLNHTFNDTAAPYPGDRCIHELIEAQAQRLPEAPAVTFEGSTLSYAELNARANRVAHFLIEQGVGPDVMVGLCAERSLEMVVGILGIIKAGGAYLPLELGLPDARLRYMLEDSSVEWLLTHRPQLSRLEWPLRRTLVLDDATGLAEYSEQDPSVDGLTPENLVYVMYTSGSTGKPKGVMIEHRAVVNRIDWGQKEYRLRPEDVVLQKTPFGFDISVFEFMWPLTVGSRLVLAKPEGHKDPAYLSKLIQTEGVTHLHFVPAMLRAMVSDPGWSACRSVRAVFNGGEALPADLIGLHYRANPAPYHNLYGPTEACIEVSHWPCPSDRTVTSVPIGRPIQNIQLHVLDARGRQTPIGVPGELHIAGAGLARGYLNRPELTAERFIWRSLGGSRKVRLYKTGDLARWLPDGIVGFHGRLDDQVKIRGFRIELGEIETHLLSQDGVSSAVAVVREDGQGDKRLLAYVTKDSTVDDAELVAGLRAELQRVLPPYMVPSAILVLDALPLTASGKIDRKALPEPKRRKRSRGEDPSPESALERNICEIWQDVLDVESIGVHDHFFEVGGNSLKAAELQRAINSRLGSDVQLTDIFAYPTAADLARHLAGAKGFQTPERGIEKDRATGRDIAIIAAACRFPDAQTPEDFWENICDGRESIQFYSDEELREAGVPQTSLDLPNFVKVGFVLDHLDEFDSGFFRFTPHEADLLDPQQRLLFECTQEALERGGYGRRNQQNKIGVFVGVGQNRYLFEHILPNRELIESFGEMAVMMASLGDFAATRLSHKLDLRGPSVNVNTACSSSLVAVHLACSSLLEGSSEMALAGASSIWMFRPNGIVADEGSIASSDGRCRTFDAGADGTRPGSGAGIVLLKRLDDAIAAGDPVLAVIKGSAINNDGANKVGYTAPSVDGQTAVIREALRAGGFTGKEVSYLEAHGTGTRLGDPIEVAALRKVFPPGERPYCALGSVKPNIGHLDSAAGIAGLIKVAMALQHGKLPPQILFERANPEIVLENSPFRVNLETVDWNDGCGPRTAGVSSFGIGGTNAHAVLQEAPARSSNDSHRDEQLVLLSARTESALRLFQQHMSEFLERRPSLLPADVAYTLQVGRESHEFRTAVVARSIEELSRALVDSPQANQASQTAPKVVFMFPGQGSQYIGMGREIYRQEPVFAAAFDRCAEILEPELGLDIRTVVFPEEGTSEINELVDETRVTQPLLFAFEYGLTELLGSWSIRPSVMIGHSLGEYVAACVAGVFDLADALKLVAARGRLMDRAERGAMLAVPLPEVRLSEQLVRTGCELAAVNAEEYCVAAGPPEAIEVLESVLSERRIAAIRLSTSHAFHTSMMDPILDDFRTVLETVALKTPELPFVSNLTGRLVTPEEACAPDYWLRHLRSTVRFGAGVEFLGAESNRIFLEVGPGATLSALVKRCASKPKVVTIVGGRRDRNSDERSLLSGLGDLWRAGISFDHDGFFAQDLRRKVVLPTHPFERRRHWLDPPQSETNPSTEPQLGFYRPSWQREHLGSPERSMSSGDWLVVENGCGLGTVVARVLEERGHRAACVRNSGGGAAFDQNSRLIDLRDSGECRALIESLKRESFDCEHVVFPALSHFERQPEVRDASTPDCADLFLAASNLARAVAHSRPAEAVSFNLVTRSTQSVTGLEDIDTGVATLAGLCKVLPQEFAGFASRQIDLDSNGLDGNGSAGLDWLIDELLADSAARSEVAYRGCHRWVRSFTPIDSSDWFARPCLLRERGVYVITGGLGRIGLALAEFLAGRYQARLALIGRSELPPKQTWYTLGNGAEVTESTRRKIRALTRIESKGAGVLVLSADVRSDAEMENALGAVERAFGTIHGVIHGAGQMDEAVAAIHDTDREHIDRQFSPKVAGVRVLDRLLSGRNVDFCLLMSSLSAVLGGLGLAAYAGANAFLDSFAQRKHNQGDNRWISINWEGWDFGDSEEAQRYQFGMSPREGQRAFQNALRRGCDAQLVQSKGPLDERLREWSQPATDYRDSTEQPAARPDTVGEYVKPRFRIETELAEIWRRFLGVQKIGINDDFFSLGGDSLVLTRVIAEINKCWRISLSIKTAMVRSTIAELAVSVAGLISAAEELESKEASFVEEFI